MKHDPKGLIYTILAGDKPIVALAANGREAGELVTIAGRPLSFL